MEATMESSSPRIRSKMALIEAIELGGLGFALWCLVAFLTIGQEGQDFSDQMSFLLVTEVILLGSWAIYNGYIRLARAGGKVVDYGLWVIASFSTASYTFWAWTILDVNRFIMAKLFYRGEAPVEYAWNFRSKQVRKAWEQARKAGYV